MAWDRGMCNTPDPRAPDQVLWYYNLQTRKLYAIQYATQYNNNIQGNSDHAYHT